MHKAFIFVLLVFACFSAALAQTPPATQINILRAEDERRFDKTLEDLLKSPNAAVRTRAALAAGRIGDEKAVPALAGLLETDASADVRAMAAFALGETESMLTAEPVLKALTDPKTPDAVRARAVEAAGKIVGANAAKGKSKMVDNLGDAILDTLREQDKRGAQQSREVVLAGLTAALRANARAAVTGLSKEEIEAIDTGGAAAPFLKSADARVRADAANTVSRVKYKKANEVLHSILRSDNDPVARANAARALGSAEDKEAFDLLLKAATEDADSRVRVSAIRSLGALKDAGAADKLLGRGGLLLEKSRGPQFSNMAEKNELLEIATVLGRLLPKTDNEKALKFLNDLGVRDSFNSPEVHIAIARVSPPAILTIAKLEIICDVNFARPMPSCWQYYSGWAQGLGELAALDEKDVSRAAAAKQLQKLLKSEFEYRHWTDRISEMAISDELRAYAAFKPADISAISRDYLTHQEPIIRAAAAEVLADQPASKENTEALKAAFTYALLRDKVYNDAQLGILDALWKLDKKESVGTLLVASGAPDYLVRKKAIEYLGDKDLQKDFPGLPASLENLAAKGKTRVLPYAPAFGTKLGQVLNTTADYTRAASRRNGQVKAVITTDKGVFTIDLLPEDAPLTVDNFIKLARAGYFNGVLVHRVVPNFVMQDGDPRGDGNGGPGWSIRCEINVVSYERGAVGMALSGKDTGGSQWFVTHAPQPHLDGGYTVFGRVDDAGMKVVDNIARGDRIVSVKIIEGILPRKGKK